MLNWISQFNIFAFLDNHQYQSSHHSIECLAAAGSVDSIMANGPGALDHFDRFNRQYPGRWKFGHLSYDLKNDIEGLHSRHPNTVGFPDLFFFLPEILIQLTRQEISIQSHSGGEEQIWKNIQSFGSYIPQSSAEAPMQARFTKEQYIGAVQKIQQHIIRGDCYEVNFCQEFFTTNTHIDPLRVYHSLSNSSPNPFSAWYRLDDRYLVCASPERYLKKEGETVFSQPIKGTSRRMADTAADEASRQALLNNPKERSENVMVVDLVRNDLSKFCREGSVEVEELFGIYSFPQVHQMVSTVRGKLLPDVSIASMIRHSFPMGSMTGAPKRRVMELIDIYEKSRRGLFSGALGYITPAEDCDFNVVIRSLLYNQSQPYLSYQAGSAITYYADAEAEYEECLLKAEAIKKVLAG